VEVTGGSLTAVGVRPSAAEAALAPAIAFRQYAAAAPRGAVPTLAYVPDATGTYLPAPVVQEGP
jgi:hypothetical protein